MKDSNNKTAKIVVWTVLLTAIIIIAPIVAFVQGVSYEKRNSAEIQVKAKALAQTIAPVAQATPPPKN